MAVERKPASIEGGFNSTLFKCITNALVSTLGEGSVQAFYYAIETKFDFPREMFERKPLEVLQDLNKFLGVGYAILEVSILREIKKTFGVAENGNLKIGPLVELAKKHYLSRDASNNS